MKFIHISVTDREKNTIFTIVIIVVRSIETRNFEFIYSNVDERSPTNIVCHRDFLCAIVLPSIITGIKGKLPMDGHYS